MGLNQSLDRQPHLPGFAKASLQHFCALVMVFHFIIITANLKRNIEIGVLAQTEGLSIQDLDHFSQDQHMQF